MSAVTYLILLLFCQYTCSVYGYVAGQLPVGSGSRDTEGCKNRTALASGDNEDAYYTYYSYCGYMRQGYHYTLNSPPFNNEMTFLEATKKLDSQYHVLKTINLTSPEAARCHFQIQQLICLTFFPACNDADQKTYYGLPCKSSCESTKTECEQLILDAGFPEWPQDIECDKYDYVDELHSKNRQIDCIKYPRDEASSTSETPTNEPVTTPEDGSTDETASEEPSTGSGFECTTDAIRSACTAKVRDNVSNKAFSNNKFDFALKGRVLEFLKIDDMKALRVNISKDFYLSCEGDQYMQGDTVVLSTDAEYDSCCLQLPTDVEYLLMGNIESDGTWKLRTSNKEKKGGSVAAVWNEDKYSKIERSWLPHCPTRVL